jgi:redox-sensitive bicupin YhaK (pirin superfamily)
MGTFLLRANDRGYDKLISTGGNASYVAGHPDAFITRRSSFNFGDYQSGRAGFGKIRVVGDEIFSHSGCGYNMHPHHDFIIMAFILQGSLVHINTIGKVDTLKPGDYYAFSAGSGGKHCELNIEPEELNVVYVWALPGKLLLPPTYNRSHFDAKAKRNQLVTLVGSPDGVLPIEQDLKISRLSSDMAADYQYKLSSNLHGVYAMVLEGSITWGGAELDRRDSAGAWDVDSVAFRTGPGTSDVLIFETVM